MEKKPKTWSNYKDLIVWKKSFALTVELYTLTKEFPKDELFGLVSQMRRSAVSIPSNIAEGQSRGTCKDFKKFLRTAYASGAELETQTLLAEKIGYISNLESIQVCEKIIEIRSMLVGLMKSL